MPTSAYTGRRRDARARRKPRPTSTPSVNATLGAKGQRKTERAAKGVNRRIRQNRVKARRRELRQSGGQAAVKRSLAARRQARAGTTTSAPVARPALPASLQRFYEGTSGAELERERYKQLGRKLGYRTKGTDIVEAITGTEPGASTAEKLGTIALTLAPAGSAARLLKGATKAIKVSDDAARVAKAPKAAPKASPRPSPKAKAAPKSKPRPKPAAKRGPNRGTRADRQAIRGAKRAGRFARRNAKKGAGGAVLSPLAVGASRAVVERDLSKLTDELEGKGIVAKASGAAGDFAANLAPGKVPGNFIRDVFDLPANIVPSVYLPGRAGAKAATGDSSELEALVDDYVKHGFIPRLAQGDLEGAGKSFGKHPLYSALEVRGATAVAGRAAGAAGRSGLAGKRGREIASTQRKSLKLGGDLTPQPRTYSRDLGVKAVQVALDDRRARKRGGQKAGRRERDRILDERTDRIVSAEELRRRQHRDTEQGAAKRDQPKRRVDREIVSLQAQGIIRSPKTWRQDLESYGRRLDRQHAKGLKPSQRRANRALRRRITRALRRGDQTAVAVSTRRNVEALNKQTDELVAQGLLTPEQAEKAKLFPYAVQHMGARFAKPEGGGPKRLLDSDGNPLPIAQIRAAMKRDSADEPGFVTQRPGSKGRGSYYRPFAPDRQTLPRQKRTGEATRKGTFDSSYQALAEQRIRNRGVIDAVKSFDSAIAELAVSGRRFRNFSDGNNAARNPREHGIKVPNDLRLVPVRVAPFRAAAQEAVRAEEIFDRLHPQAHEQVTGALHDAITRSLEPGDGPVVLVPAQAIKRLQDHFQPAGTGRKAMQSLTGAFKGAVLPTSVRWMVGNIIDVNMRSVLNGIAPSPLLKLDPNYRLGRKLTDEVRAVAAREGRIDDAERFEAQTLSGSHFGSVENTRIYRDAQQFVGTRLEPFAAAMNRLNTTPGIKHAANGYRRYRDAVFAFNERFIERQPQYAALGKQARRDVARTTGLQHRALVVGDEALEDLARGLLKTENQIRYAKSVEQIYGQWKANSPQARALLVDYAPFGMWLRAATKFVLVTMPVKHPIKTSIFAAAAEMTERERRKLGLTLSGKRAVAPYRQGSIPGPIPALGVKKGGLLPVDTYTSFGMFNDYPANVAESVLPQFSGMVKGFAGLDYKGDKLSHADGTPLSIPERVGFALWTQAEAFVPFLSQARRVREQGGSSVSGSTVLSPQVYKGTKEDTGAGIASVVNPFRPVKPSTVDYLREYSNSQEIRVPVSGGSGGSTAPKDVPWAGSGSSSSSTTKVAVPWAN